MKYLIVINIFFIFWAKFNRIAEINQLKEEAATYYQQKKFIQCLSVYEILLNHYKVTEEKVRLDMAHCYFHLKKYNSAIENYKLVLNSKDPVLKSKANLQLGVIYANNNRKELGINYFREALKTMPDNDNARYNFELLKKKQNHSQKDISPDKKRENSEGENKTTTSTSQELQKTNHGTGQKGDSTFPESEEEQNDEEGDVNTDGKEEMQYDQKGDKKTDALSSKRLEEIHISERQAKIMLRSMKNAEVQYLQQQQKASSIKSIPGKADW
ncbi:MAG TPA: hypothetical protein VK766_00200 [Cytophagaceae bacterium]|jgi:Ca-activated chloride channel family protein|nr:hypothetical protein [Cytophagaceae bacterium]